MKRLFILLTVILSAVTNAQDKAQRFDSLFSVKYGNNSFNGNVLIAEYGKVIFHKSYGKADFATGRSLNFNSVFELASVSKQFTAMGIMLLKKEQRLTYDDSLRKYFPELPYHNISVRQLLQHTSGLPDYIDIFLAKWDPKKIASNNDMIRLLANEKPAILFAPGEKWEYSNTGYALLASIIEKVSGKSFGKYLEENIFKPLNMSHTLVYSRRFEKRSIDNYAYGFGFDSVANRWLLPDSSSDVGPMVYMLDGIQGDGTVNSTTGDLFIWDQALYGNRLISQSELAEAFEPAKMTNGTTYNYGFGWQISTLTPGGKAVSHTGGWPGYSTLIERHLDHKHTIIILQNAQGKRPAMRAIRNILYNVTESKPIETKIDSISLKEYAGEYQLTEDFSIAIRARGERIFAQATGQPELEIYAEKKDLFFLKVVDAKLQFNRSETGSIVSTTLIQNGMQQVGRKIK